MALNFVESLKQTIIFIYFFPQNTEAFSGNNQAGTIDKVVERALEGANTGSGSS